MRDILSIEYIINSYVLEQRDPKIEEYIKKDALTKIGTKWAEDHAVETIRYTVNIGNSEYIDFNTYKEAFSYCTIDPLNQISVTLITKRVSLRLG